MYNTKRLQDESDGEYIYRICSNKDAIGSWVDVANVLNKELDHDYTESKYRKDFCTFNRVFEENKSRFTDDTQYLEDIRLAKQELQKERYKLQSEKIEYNTWLRENARDELIQEKIVDAISGMDKLDIPERNAKQNHKDKEYILMFGDEHYGAEFEIKGLEGEIINKYNPDVFEQRMWKLLDETIEIIQKNEICVLNVFSLGDFSDGVLRVGQLNKLKYGIVDSTVRYMEFLSNWLNELSRFVNVRFYMVNGNHSELRFFNQPKGAFKDENMGKIVLSYLKARTADNENISIVENAAEVIFANIAGYNVLGIHGEMKDMERSIKEFSVKYNKTIDFLIGGHLHHGAFETTGINQGVIRVPSIVGTDDFAFGLNKVSCPGATMIELTNGLGKTIEYSINLK